MGKIWRGPRFDKIVRTSCPQYSSQVRTSYDKVVSMKVIPQRVRKEMQTDLEYKFCMLRSYKGHVCGGRITIEHALMFAGTQVDFKNALISVCARGQEVDHYQDAHTMDKNLNRWVALNRMTDVEIDSISKAFDWRRERDRLNAIYGSYVRLQAMPDTEINYGAPATIEY